ncbi:hypothetical protein [Corynebacterium coyleae]|uniref:hypothetical protein n=1 Tax=Corynebacterium coyleae TaxID=53374 RepID=UPI00254B7754|nr:hypothetical protein [Corynebacterium coyleae]MDK8800531.1 hypothetical protein [Corynebacterium coyleae]
MPTNFKDAERMLRDFQNLLPQIVGSIVAVVSAIAVIVGLIKGGDEIIGQKDPDRPSITAPGNYSKPEFADAKYLHTHRDRVYGMQSGVGVTFNGQEHPKSLISTSNYWESTGNFDVDKKYSTLNYTAAWASNIPNSDGVGVIEVYLNGGLRDRVTVKPGESKTRNADIRGGGRVQVKMYAVDKTDDKKKVAPNGLAVLTPTVK